MRRIPAGGGIISHNAREGSKKIHSCHPSCSRRLEHQECPRTGCSLRPQCHPDEPTPQVTAPTAPCHPLDVSKKPRMVPEAIPGAWGWGASGTRAPRAGSAAAGTSQPRPHFPQSPRGGRATDKGWESSHQIPNRPAHLGGRAHLLASHTGRSAGTEAGNKPLPFP